MVISLMVNQTFAGVRVRRQDEEEDAVTQFSNLLDTLEENLLDSLNNAIDSQEAQDRILLEDVQNLIFAVQSLSDDPTLTPVALAAMATNPTSMFLIGSLVLSTVVASQVSSLALVGQTLTFDTDQGGLIRIFLDIIASVMRGFNSVSQEKIEIDEVGSGSGDYEDESGSGDLENFFNENEYYDDGSGSQNSQDGSLLESASMVIRQVLGGNQNLNDEEKEDSSGDASDDDADATFTVDIADDSFLDIVFNIIPDTVASITRGQEDEYEYVYDEVTKAGMNISPIDPSDGGSSIGGMTISLHTVDLAEMFLNVQRGLIENMGVNCTCGEEYLNSENIKEATLKLIEEEARSHQLKKRRMLVKKERYLRNGRTPKLLTV